PRQATEGKDARDRPEFPWAQRLRRKLRDDGGMVFAERFFEQSARLAGAGNRRHGRRTLSTSVLSRHLGAHAWPRPCLLHFNGPPRGRLDERTLPKHPV